MNLSKGIKGELSTAGHELACMPAKLCKSHNVLSFLDTFGSNLIPSCMPHSMHTTAGGHWSHNQGLLIEVGCATNHKNDIANHR